MMKLKTNSGPYGSFDPSSLKRVDEMFQSSNLTQIILHAHLLLEQALDKKIQHKLVRPDVFNNKKYAKISFAQKVTLYIGLYDPDVDTENILFGFNRLRNMIAHQLIDESDSVYRCLVLPCDTKAPDAISHVKLIFGFLAVGELNAFDELIWETERKKL